MSQAERLRKTIARIEALEDEAWREDADLGFVTYVVTRGFQRYGAWLFGVNFLLAHAFAIADPRTMNLVDVVEAFVGFHLAGGLIGAFLWSRNRWKYGSGQPSDPGSRSGAT